MAKEKPAFAGFSFAVALRITGGKMASNYF